MFRLARGLSLSPFRREWLVKDVVAGIAAGLPYQAVPGTGADWTLAVEPAADPATRT